MNNEDNEMKSKSRLPLTALSLDIGAVAAFLLGWGCCASVVLIALGLVLFLATAILPIAAQITAICALCLGKKRIGTSGIALSVTAIAVPVICVLVTIILFGSGIAVIHWM